MQLDPELCYRALSSRDARFDGVLFVGVTTTGIYCRPICPARLPSAGRCRWFGLAAAAEKAGFRPCLRCRPELAPGHAPVDATSRLAARALALVESAPLTRTSLTQLAHELGVSARHLRRVMTRELGVRPIDLTQTRRLLLAKRLLAETGLSLTEIAFASGFGSVRRFNSSFRARYRLAPGDLRRRALAPLEPSDAPRAGRIGVAPVPERAAIDLRLTYRPPYHWPAMLDFLRRRATPGVEHVVNDSYARTLTVGTRHGWLEVRPQPRGDALRLRLSVSLVPELAVLLPRIRSWLDLDAHPKVLDAHLAGDPLLAGGVAARPGMRLPGALDGFELATRAILGQQVSVAGATTVAGRLAARFGTRYETPIPELTLLSPGPETLAPLDVSDLTSLGLTGARARTIVALARSAVNGDLLLEPGADPEAAIERLLAVPGIGPWTAAVVAMRALHWPDAFPNGDLVLRRTTNLSERALSAHAERWRPFRSYAVIHLWALAAAAPRLAIETRRAENRRTGK